MAPFHWLAAFLFLSIFYLLLCGTKAVLALIVGRSRAFLSGKAYRLVLSGLGLVLVVFALTLFRDTLSFLAFARR